MADTPVVTGVDVMIRRLNTLTKGVVRASETSVLAAAKLAFDWSQVFVPVDKGELKASGRVQLTGRGVNARATISYGSEVAYYALYVHEDLTKHHAPPTRAKFITYAASVARPAMAKAAHGATVASLRKWYDGERT